MGLLALLLVFLPCPVVAAEAPSAPPKVVAADVLRWSQQEHQDRFPKMETLLPHRTVKAGGKVHRLPAGKPLTITLDNDGKPETLAEYMAADNTAGLLILQDGKIRLERYGPTLGREGHWASFSVTKSITSTLYGAALADGSIRSVDDSVATYLPELKGSAYEDVTVAQLLTMSSGMRWVEDYHAPNSDAAHMYTTPPDPGLDPITSYMRHLPREAPAGAKWNYKTGETDLAGILLIRATGKSLSDYLSEKIWRPYGMERDAVWMINEHGDESGGCCFSAALRDLGRFGQFVLGGGTIGGKPVLAPGWLADATRKHIETGRPGLGYGYFWWVNDDGTYDARGIFGQGIHLDPKRRLVVVVLAAWPDVFDMPHAKGRVRLMRAIEAAVDAEVLPGTGSGTATRSGVVEGTARTRVAPESLPPRAGEDLARKPVR
jgi:CubicO group peptidase (beta-lactamase class C family)